MDFTREPIIETVITPKEGCKLVVRSSKSGGQEEYFVDSLEVVSFGRTQFLRSTERPKSFLVPASDYEILEVREARMVLKNVGLDRSIKIAGGREGNNNNKPPKEQPVQEKAEPIEEEAPAEASADVKADTPRNEKKRDRRRHYRRRRGRDDKEEGAEESAEGTEAVEELAKVEMPISSTATEEGIVPAPSAPSVIPSLLPPPTMLISETIARYKDNDLFKGAFYSKAEAEAVQESETTTEEAQSAAEMSEEEEEEIYRQRRTKYTQPREEEQPFVESDTLEDLIDEPIAQIDDQAQEEVQAEEQHNPVEHNGQQ